MTDLKLVLVSNNGDTEYTKAAGFTFTKERYTPYTLFSGKFMGGCVPKEINAVKFYCKGKFLHYGTADSLVCERSGGAEFISVKSFGFSMLLGQNQSEPGIISSPDLGTIIGRNLPVKNLSYESNTKTVNYVYINEKTTIWDAICVYAMKAYGTYPYIYGTNSVRCQRYGNRSFDHSDKQIAFTRSGQKLTNLISHGYADDMEGNWTFSKVNDFAVSKNITKQRYFPHDKEWVYDLNDQLAYRLNCADRGRVYSAFKYRGFSGEDLLDRTSVSCGGFSLNDAEIDRIEISGSPKGVFTSLWSYEDSYCPQK